MVTDRLIGYTLVGGTLAALSYYTIWVIGLPFVDDDQEVILSWFPDHSLALALPLFAGILGLLCIGLYISAMMIKSKSKDHDD